MTRRIDRTQLLISIGISIGVMMMVFAFLSAESGKEAQKLPAEISTISPGPGDNVVRQSQIVIDFSQPYDGVLILDGAELPITRLDELGGGATPKPGAQVELPPTAIYDPGNFTITFQPQKGAPVEELTQGEHSAAILYWKIDETRDQARSFTWRFSVS